VEFGEAIRTCLRKYATFSGRASRSEFWYFQLFAVITAIVAGILDGAVFSSSEQVLGNGPLAWIVTVVVIVPSIAVGSRRLHDVDKTGWLQLIELTVIGLIPLLVWWATRGTRGENRYGADPIPAASPQVATSG